MGVATHDAISVEGIWNENWNIPWLIEAQAPISSLKSQKNAVIVCFENHPPYWISTRNFSRTKKFHLFFKELLKHKATRLELFKFFYGLLSLNRCNDFEFFFLYKRSHFKRDLWSRKMILLKHFKHSRLVYPNNFINTELTFNCNFLTVEAHSRVLCVETGLKWKVG